MLSLEIACVMMGGRLQASLIPFISCKAILTRLPCANQPSTFKNSWNASRYSAVIVFHPAPFASMKASSSIFLTQVSFFLPRELLAVQLHQWRWMCSLEMDRHCRSQDCMNFGQGRNTQKFKYMLWYIVIISMFIYIYIYNCIFANAGDTDLTIAKRQIALLRGKELRPKDWPSAMQAAWFQAWEQPWRSL